MEFTDNSVTLKNEVKTAEFRAQLLLEAQEKEKHNFDVLIFDLEIANVNLAKVTQEREQMQIIIDSRPETAINGKDQDAPIDRDLFNKLAYRCKEVNDEVRVLQTQLAESK
eukprot:11690603-Heterocapsa_arctica.AAC.1